MKPLEKLEKVLLKIFKNMPAMPVQAKQSLVKWLPYLALVLAVMQAIGGFAAWTFSGYVATYYQHELAAGYEILVTLNVLASLASAVLFALAYKPLKQRVKRGWQLVLATGAINVAYAIIAIFLPGYGLGTFVVSVIISMGMFYVLMQIRDQYGAVATNHTSRPKLEK